MLSSLILVLAAQARSNDCGYAAHIQEIRYTESLVVKRVAMNTDELVGELPTQHGHPACIRFTFNIDGNGHATNISAPDSSNDGLLAFAARHALDSYRFVVTTSHHERRTLVFRAIVNKAPPYPDKP